MENDMTTKERARRQNLAVNARKMITQALPVEDSDESSLMLGYKGFYLQIAFSETHPLMAIYLARALDRHCAAKDVRFINELNLKYVLGSHAVNADIGCYSFRAVHWIDAELTKPRFMEILGRVTDEAERVYAQLAGRMEEGA